MLIYLIRHGSTPGNEEGRYIGSSDESLSAVGKTTLSQNLQKGIYPTCESIYTSPMRRCIETAAILYPGQKPQIIPELREYSFGEFEGKNYQELNGNPAYQEFIDSGGRAPIPGAPSLDSYRQSCVEAFFTLLPLEKKEDMVIICHGGTIMAILGFLHPEADIYRFRVKNGEGFVMDYHRATGRIRSLRRLGETDEIAE